MDNKSLLDENCPICDNATGLEIWSVREMMYGTREYFHYVNCSECQCLSLINIPPKMEHYYPADYYPANAAVGHVNPLRLYGERLRAKYCLSGKGWLGALLAKRYGAPLAPMFGCPDYYVWFRRAGADFGSRILEIGCGNGTFLRRLQQDGFRHLVGADPFCREAITEPGFRIFKGDIYVIEEQFDIIMLHHTFEHMSDPARVLDFINARLKDGGTAIIRIPVMGTYASRTYRQNWAQIDAPRHLHLHSINSMNRLVKLAGLKIVQIDFDSDEFQFWASEQYERDIPLHDPQSYAMDRGSGVFNDHQISSYKSRAEALNRVQDGDSACFYLQKG